MTVLHYAAQRNNMDLVPWLVKQGFDVNAKNNDGKTALNLAEEVGYPKMVQWLKEHGAVE